jgi:hypothetical protein
MTTQVPQEQTPETEKPRSMIPEKEELKRFLASLRAKRGK